MLKSRQISVEAMNKVTLRRWLILFFLCLAIPTAILIQQTYSQLKWETFHQYRILAEELTTRIDKQISQLIADEEQRPFTDYIFLNIAGDSAASFLKRSPISNYPVNASIPGLVGYFQVDSQGEMLTPLVPQSSIDASSYGISNEEWSQRIVLQDRIYQILSENRLVEEESISPSEAPAVVANRENKDQRMDKTTGFDKKIPTNAAKSIEKSIYSEKYDNSLQLSGQAAFDQLDQTGSNKIKQSASKLGRIEDLKLEDRYKIEEDEHIRQQDESSSIEKKARKEQNLLPELSEKLTTSVDGDKAEPSSSVLAQAMVPTQLKIHTFESELDPFVFSQLDSGYFVLFRKVWRDDQRYIQGILIEQQTFIDDAVNKAFQQISLSQMSNLLVVYQSNILSVFTGKSSREYQSSARELEGELLYQSKLSEPLGELELLFTINQLPAGAGAQVISLITIILTIILCGGFLWMYRVGIRQIELARQQQDFVSAVSHELKTPLTSIRMYGEMLREGWAADDKKQSYYDYIFDESERLSRLINNVLQLARMTRNEQQGDFRELTVRQLMDEIASRVSTQAERAGFKLNLDCKVDATLEIDPDWFTQIIINLIDNAIKFSTNTDKKEIDLTCKQLSDGRVQFSIRDYGPGVDQQQMKKIFKLFYRSENELTRETVGTGIGLALVHQMTVAMNGQVDVINSQPGAEFSIFFPKFG